MCTRDPLLLQLLRLVDTIPQPPPPSPRRRGCPLTYPDQLFLKVILIMAMKGLPRVHEVYSVLRQFTPDIIELRALLFPNGKMPSRRTFERRLKRLPQHLPDWIAYLGEHLVSLYQPWQHSARAAAMDSTALRARGTVWHQKDRATGHVPNTSIDTDAHWTKSGWHGWVFGYKLHLIVTMASVWIPLAAQLRPANEADNVVAERLVAAVRAQVRFYCGDSAYNCDSLRLACEKREATLVASSRSKGLRIDPGKEVRKIIHVLRHHTIENFNGLFKNIFDARRPIAPKGITSAQRYFLGAVLAYQVALLYRYHSGVHHQTGIKALLRSA
jgi:hypothetical protein